MNTRLLPMSVAIIAVFALNACAQSVSGMASADSSITGAWRSQIRFSSGDFAATRDLEFMYVFNAGGTLTESSNYDAAPPVAPAYGVWRSTAPREFEAKYLFYITAPPQKLDDLTSGGGWGPAGVGVFLEKIKLSADGRSFMSTIDYSAFDAQGKPVKGGGKATGSGSRIAF